jgi:hypothetical protein
MQQALHRSSLVPTWVCCRECVVRDKAVIEIRASRSIGLYVHCAEQFSGVPIAGIGDA